MHKVINSFRLLKEYCENEGFKGWDPYDGLNSKVFQALPFLKKSAICRLVVIQGFKRCPVNLRRLALVPKEYNAKGIGLFLSGYCNLYNAVKANPKLAESLGSPDSLKSRINELAELLISLQSKGYSGACWGYNFDWQARRLSFSQSLLQPLLRAISVQPLLWKHTKLPERKGFLKSLSVRHISLSTTFTARNIRTDSYSLTARCRETTLSLTPHCSAQGCLVFATSTQATRNTANLQSKA